MSPNTLAILLYASESPVPAIRDAYRDLIILTELAGDQDELRRLRRIIAATIAFRLRD